MISVHLDPSVALLDFLVVCSRLPADEIEQYEAFSGRRFDFEWVAATWFAKGGHRWAIRANDEAIVVAGFDEIRPGVWQDWMFSSPAAWEHHWRPVTRIARRAMDEMLRGPAHRLQCVSLASRIQAHKWYRPLGLKVEGTLHGYGINGEDALMFSRLRSPDGN